MTLAEQVVDVPLMPMNEQSLALAGPVGRIKSMSNMVARKVTGTQGGTRMRLEKRPGSQLLTGAPTSNLITGGVGTAPANVTLLEALGPQLVEVGGGLPYVYSPAAGTFGQYTTAPRIDTRVIQRRSLANANAVLYAPDVAAVSNVLMYTFASRDPTTSARTGYATLVDGQGVQIRAPFSLGGDAVKVLSDGVRFWVFIGGRSATSAITVKVFDTTGTQLATTTLTLAGPAFSWDVHWDAGVGVWTAAGVAANNLDIRSLTYAAGVITAVVQNLTVDLTAGCAFLENTRGDAHIYIAGVNTAFHVSAYQIDSVLFTLTHTYNVDATNSVYVGNITGYVANSSFDIVVAYSRIQNTPLFTASFAGRDNVTILVAVTFAGVSALYYAQGCLSLASRAFKDAAGNWSAVMYYQSTACFSSVGTPVGPADVSQIGAQPTYFVMTLSGRPAAGQAITGQFETGSAYQFAQSRNSLDLYPFHLSSIAVETQSTTAAAGAQHIPLGYLGEQQALSVTIAGTPFTVFVALAGIRDYVILPYSGRAVTTADTLLLPGLHATRFDTDSFTEDGFALAPEIVSVTLGGGGLLTNGEAYTWVVVWEWLDGNGDVVESAVSVPVSATPGAPTQQATLVIASDRVTGKVGARASVYRTYSPTLTTTAGVILRKVGEVVNNTGTSTVTFVDQLADSAAQLGQELYSQILDLSASPALDYFAAPAFRQGCFADNRAFVVAYDNTLRFSMEKVAGHALAWNPELQVTLPTTDTMLSAQVMDQRIVIQCDKSVWSIPIGNLPNAALTAGAIPTPEQFPLPTGALGPAFPTPLGLLYAAPSGIWSLDRSLAAQYVGAAVQDETGAGIAQITSATVDNAQRVYFTLSTKGNPLAAEALSGLLVYDLITNAWYVWSMNGAVVLATVWRGQLTFVNVASQTWTLDDALTSGYTDNGISFASRFTIAPIVLSSVNGYQSVLQVQFYGIWKGAHTVTVGVSYDGSATIAESFPQVVNADPGVYRYDFIPKQADCQAIGFTFSDGAPAGNSFAIETLSLLVGVEQGLGRIPPATNRIAPA